MKPKLLEQVRAKIRLKHYSIRTEQTYLQKYATFDTRLMENTLSKAFSRLLYAMRKGIIKEIEELIENMIFSPSPKSPPIKGGEYERGNWMIDFYELIG